MPLKSLAIQSFQSLRDVSLDLDGARFVVVVGDSDVGKSALVRALSALANNRTGQDFVSKGESTSTVAAEFEDGVFATWLKGSAGAQYRLRNPASRESRFEKMGRGVPDEVARATRIGALEISGERFSPNIHSQFDHPFLVADSPSARAKVLGEVSGVNILVQAVSAAQGRERAAKREQTVRESDLEAAKAELEQYAHLPAIEERLNSIGMRIEELAAAREDGQNKARLLNDAIQASRAVSSTQEEADALSAIPQFEDAQQAVAEYWRKRNLLDDAIGAIAEYEDIESALTVVDWDIVDATKALGEVQTCPTCGQAIDAAALV